MRKERFVCRKKEKENKYEFRKYLNTESGFKQERTLEPIRRSFKNDGCKVHINKPVSQN